MLKEVSHVMSGTIFFICWTSWIQWCFRAAISLSCRCGNRSVVLPLLQRREEYEYISSIRTLSSIRRRSYRLQKFGAPLLVPVFWSHLRPRDGVKKRFQYCVDQDDSEALMLSSSHSKSLRRKSDRPFFERSFGVTRWLQRLHLRGKQCFSQPWLPWMFANTGRRSTTWQSPIPVPKWKSTRGPSVLGQFEGCWEEGIDVQPDQIKRDHPLQHFFFLASKKLWSGRREKCKTIQCTSRLVHRPEAHWNQLGRTDSSNLEARESTVE